MRSPYWWYTSPEYGPYHRPACHRTQKCGCVMQTSERSFSSTPALRRGRGPQSMMRTSERSFSPTPALAARTGVDAMSGALDITMAKHPECTAIDRTTANILEFPAPSALAVMLAAARGQRFSLLPVILDGEEPPH